MTKSGRFDGEELDRNAGNRDFEGGYDRRRALRSGGLGSGRNRRGKRRQLGNSQEQAFGFESQRLPLGIFRRRRLVQEFEKRLPGFFDAQKVKICQCIVKKALVW